MADGGEVPEALRADLQGESYITLLERLHRVLRPRTYLEIGSRVGESLALAQCASIAVDPYFDLAPAFLGEKPLCALYRTTSDRFFADVDPRQVLGGPVELAFLDGMHLAEFLLRDFMNVERHARPNSVIAIHDCVPVEAAMTRRVEDSPAVTAAPHRATWWTGDIWKVIVALQRHRPDLRIVPADAGPTGLMLVTNLDPGSTVLAERQRSILDEFQAPDPEHAALRQYVQSLELVPTASLSRLEDISRYFWL